MEIIVEIVFQNGKQFLRVQVRDTGAGIPKASQKQLFKFFGFLNETKEMNRSGVGLGLAIAKQIVNQYNGQISVDSIVGVGSTFTFSFELEGDERQNAPQIMDEDQQSYKLHSPSFYFTWRPKNGDVVTYVDHQHDAQSSESVAANDQTNL